MKILYLTYYFRPDLCAGSFRNSSLFEALLKQVVKEDFVHVITTVPNRYGSYSVEGLAEETGENYKINACQWNGGTGKGVYCLLQGGDESGERREV